MTAKAETVMQAILQHDERHLLYYLVLLEISKALREAWPQFTLSHFALIADELDVDLLDVHIRPRVLSPTSEGVGLVAAGVWGEGPEARWTWKQRLIAADLPEPTIHERAVLLERVERLPFVSRASWADGGAG